MTSLTPFENCNKHGLYQGETVTVTAANRKAGLVAECGLASCDNVISECDYWVAESLRLGAQVLALEDGSADVRDGNLKDCCFDIFSDST